MSSDEQLVQSLISGDADALNELYARFAKKLYVFIAHSMKSRNPEDLVHDVFLKVIESAHTFNPEKATFRTWLFSIARNLCLDHIRRDQKIRHVPLDRNDLPLGHGPSASFKDRLADASQHVEVAHVQSRILMALDDCIARLEKDENRQCLILYYLTGKVYREIGEIFGKSISMIKKRITAAREKVRYCLHCKGFDSFPEAKELPDAYR